MMKYLFVQNMFLAFVNLSVCHFYTPIAVKRLSPASQDQALKYSNLILGFLAGFYTLLALLTSFVFESLLMSLCLSAFLFFDALHGALEIRKSRASKN